MEKPGFWIPDNPCLCWPLLMTDQPRSSRNSGRSGGWLSRWLFRGFISLIGCAGVLLICWVFTVIFGRVTGEEFSPQLFQRRTFIYFEIPLLRVQVWPIRRESSTGAFERFLTRKGYIKVNSTKKPRWDLVFDSEHDPTSALCDAAILCKYFDTVDADQEFIWKNWTAKHPELAKRLWPAVAEVAQARCYIFIPDLIDVARRADDEKKVEFQQVLDTTLAAKFREAAKSEQHFERHARAVALFTLALSHDGDDLESLRGRAASFAAQGKPEKAAVDLAAARQLETK